MTADDFPQWVKSRVDEIPFDLMYSNVHAGEYIPSDVVNMIQLTLYHLEHEKRLVPPTAACLGYYLEIALGANKHRNELNRNELLYIIHRCKTEVDGCKSKSPNNKHGMYI